MAHPSDCGSYLVCCSSEAVPYECLKQRAGDATPYPRYGTAQRLSYYNAFSAACERCGKAAERQRGKPGRRGFGPARRAGP